MKCIFGEVYDSLDDKSSKYDGAGEVLWGRRLPALVLAFGLVPGGFIRVYVHSTTRVRMNATTSAISCGVSVFFQDGMNALLPAAAPPSAMTSAR